MKDKNFQNEIRLNIDSHGYHVNIVSGGQEPRYAYTIGLLPKFGFELIFAGGVYFLKKDLYTIFESIVNSLEKDLNPDELYVKLGNSGDFKLRKVHSTWSDLTMLGVKDYFDIENFNSMQIIPDIDHWTLDIPDMTKKWESKSETIWKGLSDDWNYEAPNSSNIVTNIDALKGETITEVMRWESDEWEMFAGPGPDVEKDQIRVVPLGVMIGIDSTLTKSLELEIGKGIWRDDKSDKWTDWG